MGCNCGKKFSSPVVAPAQQQSGSMQLRSMPSAPVSQNSQTHVIQAKSPLTAPARTTI